MSLQKLGEPVSSRSALRTIGLLFLLIAIGAGARFAWHQYKTRPLTVAQTREAIRAYLEEKAGVRRFDPPPLAMAGTNAPGDDDSQPAEEGANSKKAEKKKKKKNHPAHEQFARDFRRSIKESADYKTTYRLLGENLAHADQLLESREPELIEAALSLAAAASRAALDPAVDSWLAARIAEAYLWPHLDNAPASDKSGIDAGTLLDISEEAFTAADETDNLVRNYQLLIARSQHPGKTDKFRIRLAKLLESQQKFAEALRVLHQVQETNSPAVVRRIASLEMMRQQARTRH